MNKYLSYLFEGTHKELSISMRDQVCVWFISVMFRVYIENFIHLSMTWCVTFSILFRTKWRRKRKREDQLDPKKILQQQPRLIPLKWGRLYDLRTSLRSILHQIFCYCNQNKSYMRKIWNDKSYEGTTCMTQLIQLLPIQSNIYAMLVIWCCKRGLNDNYIANQFVIDLSFHVNPMPLVDKQLINLFKISFLFLFNYTHQGRCQTMLFNFQIT